MDTIAAISTPPQLGAIGIVRLSGPNAISAISAIFAPTSGKSMATAPSRQLVYGTLHDRDGRPIDKALATISHGPSSYTGEDTAELQCHGSPIILGLALEALFAHGVRQALGGEFTKRAFLNGRLDLTEAEAVIDLIQSETPAAVHQAVGQLSGGLSKRADEIYHSLVDLMAHFHAVLDYPDEDIDPFGAQVMADTLSTAKNSLTQLLATYDRGRFIARGVPCAIVGRPNGGKSSLLNALLGYDRAIVTPIAGTTRDTIEEKIQLGDTLLRLIDTAGIRDAVDEVEQMGVARSQAALEGASLILLLIDGTAAPTQEDIALLAKSTAIAPTIVVRTKSDVSAQPMGQVEHPHQVTLSNLTGEGLAHLSAMIAELFPTTTGECGEILSNARQAEAVTRALAGIDGALDALHIGLTPDALLTDVEEAISALASLTGRTIREDVTARIFERFCVGK